MHHMSKPSSNMCMICANSGHGSGNACRARMHSLQGRHPGMGIVPAACHDRMQEQHSRALAFMAMRTCRKAFAVLAPELPSSTPEQRASPAFA